MYTNVEKISEKGWSIVITIKSEREIEAMDQACLLYTSDAADEAGMV